MAFTKRARLFRYVPSFTLYLPAPTSTYRIPTEFDSGANASTISNYGLTGIPPYVRGMQNGMGVDPGSLYYGPYGSENITYTYDESNGAGPHAVTSRSNGDTFSYDANGNMTTRYDADDSTTWTYTFDAENRLVSASDGTTTIHPGIKKRPHCAGALSRTV